MKALTAILFLIGVLVTCFFGDIYFERRALSYENGRYFDAGQSVVFPEHSVTVYLLLFLGSLVLTLYLLFIIIRRTTNKGK
jgi:hypothetical protein